MLRIKLSLIAFCGLGSLAFGTPDLVCGDIVGASSFGVVDGVAAYSFGTTICNHGDSAAEWDGASDAHPLISQSIYKLKDHKITQIGIGFVRHTTIPLQSNACGLGCSPVPGFEMLGAGCSTSSGASVNGSQELMGPRSEVDAWNGDFLYPFTTINQTGDAVYKRLKVSVGDVSDPDALYFIETQLVVPDEITIFARNNNASYQRIEFTPASLNATAVGASQQGVPAIYAWADHGLGANTPDPSVMISEMQIPGDGIVHLGSRVTDLGDGTWRYDYAVHNQNSDRGIGSLRIPALGGVPSAFVFHGVQYLDAPDNAISADSWNAQHQLGEVLWETEDYSINMNANAIRWGTMYTFSFVSQTAPSAGSVELGMFSPGNHASVFADAFVPGVVSCLADVNGDGAIDGFDVSLLVNGRIDLNGDTSFDFFDISVFLQSALEGCP